MELSLNPELEALIHIKVQSGPYRSAAEVVGTALHLLDERDRYEQQHEAVRREVALGLEQADRGELRDGEEVFARLLQEAEQAVRDAAAAHRHE